MVTDPLREFFESLATEEALRELVREQRPEDIHLEFKQKKDRSRPELDDSDAFQFSRALSGFANSDGGMLVWRVETDKEERAKRLRPISSVRDFQGRLKKSLLNTVQPVVDGIWIDVVATDDDATAGYVKCLVPASDKSPHRAMQAGREYFKRSTEGFYRLEHFDLEDMFGRRPVPRIALETRIVQRGTTGGGGGTTYRGLLILSIVNRGRGSARAPYLAVATAPPYAIARYGLDGNGHEGLPRIQTADDRRVIYSSSDIVIHPGVSYETAAIEIAGRANHRNEADMPPDLHVGYELASEGARLQRDEIVISGFEIARALFPRELLEGFAAPAP